MTNGINLPKQRLAILVARLLYPMDIAWEPIWTRYYAQGSPIQYNPDIRKPEYLEILHLHIYIPLRKCWKNSLSFWFLSLLSSYTGFSEQCVTSQNKKKEKKKERLSCDYSNFW